MNHVQFSQQQKKNHQKNTHSQLTHFDFSTYCTYSEIGEEVAKPQTREWGLQITPVVNTFAQWQCQFVLPCIFYGFCDASANQHGTQQNERNTHPTC